MREILELRASFRRRTIDQIARIAENPFTLGNFEVIDSHGRKNQIVVTANVTITYWADHAVKEVRILHVRTH